MKTQRGSGREIEKKENKKRGRDRNKDKEMKIT